MLITKADIGRKVIHHDGSVGEIMGWCEGDSGAYPVESSNGNWYAADGRLWEGADNHYDIIAFADEQERKMKHVIAGEAQEDVLEWMIDTELGDKVRVSARKLGGSWRSILIV